MEVNHDDLSEDRIVVESIQIQVARLFTVDDKIIENVEHGDWHHLSSQMTFIDESPSDSDISERNSQSYVLDEFKNNGIG
jgi:hypothetical protein